MLIQAASSDNLQASHNFFSQFEYIHNLQVEKNHEKTIKNGLNLLETCRRLDLFSYEKLHKGSPFYWIAIASFEVGDFQQATFFFDAAISEDNKNSPGSKTPAHLFVLMDSSEAAQYGRSLTYRAEFQFGKHVDDYNEKFHPQMISKDEIRDKFISKAINSEIEWRSLATSLVSYLLELEDRQKILSLRLESGTYEPFYSHLFKGCVLFESLIKCSPYLNANLKSGFIRSADLSKLLNNRIVRERLGFDYLLKISSTLSAIIKEIDDNPDLDKNIINHLELTGKIRNSITHSWVWNIELSPKNYGSLAKIILHSCFYVINKLF